MLSRIATLRAPGGDVKLGSVAECGFEIEPEIESEIGSEIELEAAGG